MVIFTMTTEKTQTQKKQPYKIPKLQLDYVPINHVHKIVAYVYDHERIFINNIARGLGLNYSEVTTIFYRHQYLFDFEKKGRVTYVTINDKYKGFAQATYLMVQSLHELNLLREKKP